MECPELTAAPQVLFDERLTADGAKIYGRKLGDSVSTIDWNDIDTITLEKPPAEELFGGNGKDWLYKVNGETRVFSFERRIESVIQNGGCLHMKYPVTYIIDNEQLIGIKLYCEEAGLYQDIGRREIEESFGHGATISENYFKDDDSLSSTLFSYEQRQIFIDVSASTNKISFIHFGQFPFKIAWLKNCSDALCLANASFITISCLFLIFI